MSNTTLRITELCKMRGITKAQLAAMLGIRPASFSQAISRNKFDLDYLGRLAECLEVDIRELFAPSDNENYIRCPHCGKRITFHGDENNIAQETKMLV